MKRLVFWTSAVAAMLVAGCSAEPAGADAAASTNSSSTATATASAAPAASGAQAVVFENNDQRGEYVREFAYNWPAQVAAVPALVERFSGERDGLLAEQREDFESALRDFAGEDCVGCVNRGYAKEWQVVADLPRFLSLSATVYVYSGGAHPNGDFDALLWDREAGVALNAAELFTSGEAMQEALGARWCAALRKERTKRLGEDYGEDETFPCPPLKELAVLPGSAGKRAFDRIGLLAAPYVAGSYAEGSYEVTLPVTRQVIAAVKPGYRAYFAVGK